MEESERKKTEVETVAQPAAPEADLVKRAEVGGCRAYLAGY